MSLAKMKKDVLSDYENMREYGKMSLKEKGGKHNDYVTDEEVIIVSNLHLGTKNNKYGIAKNSIRSTISQMIYRNTDGYKKEMKYREGEMLKQVELISLIDHNNGYITLTMHSTKIDYSVELLVMSGENDYTKRGTITG